MSDTAGSLSPEIQNFVAKSVSAKDMTALALAGDASSRRYFRIVVGDQSWVLMVWEPFQDPAAYPFLNVQAHFHKHGVQVPEVVALSPELGVVLLEDLGDLTLERKFWENQDQSLAVPYYRLALAELIKIHYAASNDQQPSCTAFQVQFDTAKLLWEMNYGKEHAIEKINQIKLSSVELKELDKVFTSICETLDREPKRVAHRDYHSRNLMLKLGKVRVIDFQDARLGPIQYDLVSLLHDSYVALDANQRQALLSDYLDHARPFLGAKFSHEHFMEIFTLQVLQRCFKACGSFASFYNLRKDRRYLKYIQPTLKLVAKTAQDLPAYRSFAQILNDHGLPDINFESQCAP